MGRINVRFFFSRIGAYPLVKDQIVIFPDFDLNGRTSDEIILFDNITFSANFIKFNIWLYGRYCNNYNASATTDDGSCTYDVTLTVDMNCSGLTPGYVAATGPSDGWSCGAYALTDADGDGVWEGTFSLPVGDFEYIYCTDGWAGTETAGLITEMQNGETCAPVTDYFSYANRLITVGAITTTDTWGSCSPCSVSGPVSGCTDSTSE